MTPNLPSGPTELRNKQTRTHLTILFDEAAVPALAAARHRWDPDMALGVPPHITVVYPEEFNNRELLEQRATEVTARFGRFTLSLDRLVGGNGDGSGGVFAELTDPTGSWSGLRETLLQPPFAPVDVRPHLTVVHARTSRRGVEAWRELTDLEVEGQLPVTEVCLTSTELHGGMSVLRRFSLDGGARQLCAAVILVTESAGLLGLRARNRSWYPGVWDLIGGRVEPGEDPKVAACREANEELGVVVSPEDLRHVDTVVTDDAETVVYATSTWINDPLNSAPAEHQEIRWLKPVEVSALETSHPRIGQLVASACGVTGD